MVGRQPAGESVVAGACSRLPVQLSAHEDNRSLARSSDGGCAYVCVCRALWIECVPVQHQVCCGGFTLLPLATLFVSSRTGYTSLCVIDWPSEARGRACTCRCLWTCTHGSFLGIQGLAGGLARVAPGRTVPCSVLSVPNRCTTL